MSLGRELLQRKVPQYTGAYVGICWGLIEFTSWLEQRYLLSPALTDLLLVLFTLLLPSVLLVAYVHGRRGLDRTTRLERILVPGNVLVAAIVLMGAFSGDDLGAMTTRVRVRDENGQQLERRVPNPAFRKRVAIFRFDAASDTLAQSLAAAFPTAIAEDLGQNVFADVKYGLGYRDVVRPALQRAGLADGRNVPLMLKLQIARSLSAQYVLYGDVVSAAGELSLTTVLYCMQSAAVKHAHSFAGPDFHALVDSVTAQLVRDLELPHGSMPGTQDLPSAEVTTRSVPAIRAYASALEAIVLAEDWTSGQRLLERAIQLDSTFALAQWRLAQAFVSGKDPAAAERSLQAALRFAYRLPERSALELKADYHWVVGDAGKAIAVLELRSQLQPDDKPALVELADGYRYTSRFTDAESVLERALALDTSDAGVLGRLMAVAAEGKDTAKAVAYGKEYLAHAPTDPDRLLEYAEIFAGIGRYEQMRTFCDRALMLSPDNAPAMTCLGRLAKRVGDWDTAESLFLHSLTNSRTPTERAEVYFRLYGLAINRGQLLRALDYLQRHLQVQESNISPVDVLTYRANMATELHARLGHEERALALIDTLERSLTRGEDMWPHFYRALAYTWLHRVGEAERELSLASGLVRGSADPVWSGAWVETARAVLRVRQKRFEAAIAAFRKAATLHPHFREPNALYTEALLGLGRYGEARAQLDVLLRDFPAEPNANAQMGLLLLATGDTTAARNYLQRAMVTWSEADPEFEEAVPVRAALAALGTSGDARAAAIE